MGEGNDRGISGFAVNRGAVNRGFTVVVRIPLLYNSCIMYNTSFRLTGDTRKIFVPLPKTVDSDITLFMTMRYTLLGRAQPVIPPNLYSF